MNQQQIEIIQHMPIMGTSTPCTDADLGTEARLKAVDVPAKATWSEADGIFYVNVYSDEQGGIHYSTEEFRIGQKGLFTVDAALRDAYELTVKSCNWDYLQTLCTEMPEETTSQIRKCLGILGEAFTIVNEREDARNYRMEDIEERAEEIVGRTVYARS